MKNSKLIIVILITLCSSYFVFAQQTVTQDEPTTEVTVEQQYLSTVEDVIINELSKSDNFDTKLVALRHIEDALNAGRISPEIEISLESLAGEGVLKQSRTNNRLSNNYPQIRSKACDLLGEVNTEQAKETLLNIATEEKEPMVLASIVRSFGKIGINDDNEVSDTIAWIERRYSIINPTDSLAYEVLDTYEILLPGMEDKNTVIESIAKIAANYRYVTPIRTKALDLLKSLANETN